MTLNIININIQHLHILYVSVNVRWRASTDVDVRSRMSADADARWRAVTDVDVRPLTCPVWIGVYTTSSIVRDRIQLTTCRSSRVASPFSSMPISRCRRSTLLISQQRLTSSHAQLRTCPYRLFRCDRRPAIDELTPVSERVKFDVAFMHRIVSYRDILCDIDRIVSFSLRPYRANTTINTKLLSIIVIMTSENLILLIT